MSAQAAGRAVAQAGKAASKQAEGHVLNKGAKRDPELYVRSSSSFPLAHDPASTAIGGSQFDPNMLRCL